jgi:hypothetical protein
VSRGYIHSIRSLDHGLNIRVVRAHLGGLNERVADVSDVLLEKCFSLFDVFAEPNILPDHLWIAICEFLLFWSAMCGLRFVV